MGVGKHLKTTTGWYDSGNGLGNGTDDYGFSGLPSGVRGNQSKNNGVYFFYNYYGTLWWGENRNEEFAQSRYLDHSYQLFIEGYNHRDMGYSVRCIRNENNSTAIPVVVTDEIYNISATSASCSGNVIDDGGATYLIKGICWNTSGNPTNSDNTIAYKHCLGNFSGQITGLMPNTTYYVKAYAFSNSSNVVYGDEKSFTTKETSNSIVSGTFIDSRDNHTYKWVKIGDQVWMAENLAYLPQVNRPENGDSYFRKFYYVYGYDGTDVKKAKALLNYHKFGVLYNGPATKDACPSGWHLSTLAEWNTLVGYIGENGFSNNTGASLRAGAEWSNNGNGTDDFGFSALPAGYRTTPTYDPFTGDLITKGGFESIGDYGFWYTYNYTADKRTIQRLRYDSEYLFGYSMGERLGLSVRWCKK